MSFKEVLVIVVAFVLGFLAVNAWLKRDARPDGQRPADPDDDQVEL